MSTMGFVNLALYAGMIVIGILSAVLGAAIVVSWFTRSSKVICQECGQPFARPMLGFYCESGNHASNVDTH